MPDIALSNRYALNPVQHVILAKLPETGMGRFFSPTTLNLFRRLASDEIAIAERRRVLEALAQEWEAFMRECRVTPVSH